VADLQVGPSWIDSDPVTWATRSASNQEVSPFKLKKVGWAQMADAQAAPKLDTLHHVAVAVCNVKETVDWYTQHFDCRVAYQDATWALVQFANVSLAFVVPEQHPPHIAFLGDPTAHRNPQTHRDGTRSVYVQDPAGNNVEILALE
jgi:catechol-2,3-dioxygenase